MAGSLQRRRNVARAAYIGRDSARLERACTAILKAEPSDVEARRLLGRDALRDHRSSEAEEIFRTAAARNPTNPSVWADLARAYAQRRALDQAEATLAAASARGVRSAATLTFLGRMRHALDREDAARAAYEAAIELDAAYGDAYRGLAEIGGLSAGEPLRATAERRVEDARLGPVTRAAFAHALAETAAGEQDPAAMRLWLERANAGLLAQSSGDSETSRRPIHLRQAIRGAATIAKHLNAAPPTDPPMVFILGPAGAGATLIEDALAREAHLAPGGVNGVLAGPVASRAAHIAKRPAALAARKLNRAHRVALAREYLRRLGALTPTPPRLDEAVHLCEADEASLAVAPLAAALFANARFVRVRRDLRDCGLVVFRRADASGAADVCDWKAIGETLALSERALDALGAAVPLVEARYEDFAEDAGGAARRLAGALDIPQRDAPEPAPPGALGLESWEAQRTCMRVAPGDWRLHEEALAPLIKALKAGGASLD